MAMKKILLVLILVLSLSGCEMKPIRYEVTAYNNYESCGAFLSRGFKHLFKNEIEYVICDDDKLTEEEYFELKDYHLGFYTKKEVDEMFENYTYNRDVNLTVQFDEREYDFWLVRIVSKVRDDERNIYIYKVEEVGDEDYYVTIESDVLFSVNELALGVEGNDVLFIIDFNNGDVVIPKLEELDND